MTEDSARTREAHAVMARMDDLIRIRIKQHEYRRAGKKELEQRARSAAYEVRESLHTALLSLGLTIEEEKNGNL